MKKGLVIKSTGSWYSVKLSNGTIIQCRIKGKFRLKGIETTNPVTVGDIVSIEIQEDDNGMIVEIETRKNYIIRKSVNLSKKAHIIASNIDLAFLVVTVNYPKTYLNFIDRFLVTAEAYHIPTTLVFNKIDLLNDNELKELNNLVETYSKIGYSCIKTSVEKNINIEEVKAQMKNKTSVFSGNSGVGKSSLINLIDNSLDIKTSDISDSHNQGKHTTTFAEMHELKFGGHIIDTPGIKGLGIIDIEQEVIHHYFPEMRAIMNECKFNNCVHVNEPKCAVKKAVEEGNIAEFRYQNYLNLYYGDENPGFRESLYAPK
ncbi:MAG: ribosome small subunit-dependent GTPase A [Flavobacteriales bacterium]